MNTDNDAPDERFYVVGNGPSLSRRLLAALPAGRWLGMNSAYRYWEQTGQYPRLYACVDPVVGKAQAEGIARLIERPEVEALLLHEDVAQALPAASRLSPKIVWRSEFVKQNDLKVPFSALAIQKQTTGALATRFAIARGYRNLQLLGIDCRYVEVIDEAQQVSGIELRIGHQPKTNPNYFFAGYQSVGDTYQVPNPPVHSGNLHLQSFVALRNDAEACGADVKISVGSLDSLLAQHGIFDYESPFAALGIRRIGAVAVPLMARELPQLVENLRQWADARTAPTLRPDIRGTRLHLLFSDRPTAQEADMLQRAIEESSALRSTFDEVRWTVLPIPDALNHYARDASTTDSPSTKSGPNCAFLAAMAQLAEYDYTLHIETDCIPIRFGWLDAAERAIERAGEDSWIIGAGYFGPMRLRREYRYHLNGNAIYKTGDTRFRSFLSDVFVPTLLHFLDAGIRDLAYDTTLSMAYENVETLPQPLTRALQSALPRFSFTNLILNVGGSVETRNPEMVPMNRILAESDEVFFMHGRAALVLGERHRVQMKESYRDPGPDSASRPALYWASASDKNWKAEVEGYGRVALRRSGPCPGPGRVRLNHVRLGVAPTGRRHFRGSLALDLDITEVPRVELLIRRSGGAAVSLPCRAGFKTNGTTCLVSYEASTEPLEGGETFVDVVIDLPATARDTVSITQAELVEEPASVSGAGLGYTLVDASEGCLAAIREWGAALDRLRLLRLDRSTPMVIDCQSSRFTMRSARFDGLSLQLDLEHSLLKAPVDEGTPMVRLVVRDWGLHKAASFDIIVRQSSDAPSGGNLMLRLCRHGSGPWQHRDLPFRMDGSGGEARGIPSPFTEAHESYRLELHQAGSRSIEHGLQVTITVHERPHTGVAQAASALPSAPIGPLHQRRILVIDPTRMAGATATGQLKSLLFGRWSAASLRQLWDRHTRHERYAFGAISGDATTLASANDLGRLLAACKEFDPELIYVRPVDDPEFIQLATAVLDSVQCPAVVHIMDDWMERARGQNPAGYGPLGDGVDAIIARCTGRLSISAQMSSMLAFRYGHTWTPVANGVRTADFRDRAKARQDKQPFVIRYMGGLADDMCWSTVQRVARTVQAMSSRVPVRFDVHTMDWYIPKARKAWEGMNAVSVGGLVEADRYQESLASADALLVAYNFDEKSIAYTRYSRSNKLPECLLSGTPVLAIGPAVCCTLAELADARDACMLVTSEEPAELEQAIARLMGDEAWLAQRPAAVRRLLSTRFDVETTISTFERVLGEALTGPVVAPPAAQPRPSSIAEANLAFRQGELQTAFRAYAALYRAHPLPMYRENALRCLVRAGLDPASFEHAAQTWHHAPQPSTTQRAS